MGRTSRGEIHIDLDALTTAFPSQDIERILDDLGCREKRRRKLPAVAVVYHVIALGLMISTGAKEVLRRLLDQVREREWVGGLPLASEAAITKARKRLGAAPVRELFNQLARPIAKKTSKGCWFRSRRVVSLDGSTLQVQDSSANEQAFGRPQTAKTTRPAAYPLIRFVMLIENGTRAPFAAAMDSYSTSEVALA